MDTILDIISRLVDYAFDFACIPLISDTMFRRGFIVALITGLVVGKVSSWLIYWRGLIRAFFQPSAIPVPSSRPGPSGLERARGCLTGMLLLTLAGVVAFICIASLLAVLARGEASP